MCFHRGTSAPIGAREVNLEIKTDQKTKVVPSIPGEQEESYLVLRRVVPGEPRSILITFNCSHR